LSPGRTGPHSQIPSRQFPAQHTVVWGPGAFQVLTERWSFVIWNSHVDQCHIQHS
jgi:hypothetical protein